MAQKTSFKDALDYIFIANDSGSNTYLISDSMASSKVTSAFASASTATAATATATATTAATAATAAASIAVAALGDTDNPDTTNSLMLMDEADLIATNMGFAALITDNNIYNSVAVGLGAMLINDSLSSDGSALFGVDENTTNFFAANESDLIVNGTNANATSTEDIAELIRMAVTSIILGLMILVTIVGNVFVIAAIILERNLQNVANYLVASLAVADLFVACLVMPLGAVYEISQGWILGPELCDIWTSCDVLCCTASILHLVAIAVDRYWAVTNIDYIHSRTSRRVFLMIFFVWSAAVIVSLAPQFGWKDPNYLQRIEQQKCMVSQDVAYQVFATCCTFYVPLLVILVLYWKIYQTARKRIHRRRPRPIDVTANNNQPYLSAQKKRKHLRLRIGKFSADKTNPCATAGNTLGLVEGNSTNTVNTVEDTEFSSSNIDNKSRAGIEVTTVFSNIEQGATTSASQISTVSHLVALANQQHAAAPPAAAPTTAMSSTTAAPPSMPTHDAPKAPQQQQHQLHFQDQSSNNQQQQQHHHHHHHHHQHQHHQNSEPLEDAAHESGKQGAGGSSSPSVPANTSVSPVNGLATSDGNGMAALTANGETEVLEDPQLQQQFQQVQQEAEAAVPTELKTAMKHTNDGGGGTNTSNATTITSISALSPQTPTQVAISAVPAAIHPLSDSDNASNQVTPLPKAKAQQHQHLHPQSQQQQQQLASISNPQQKVAKRKETLEAKRERKAAKTLAIITGAFVVCWLPFFVMALLLPLCAKCKINDSIAALFLWLGYFNSTLNPVIYTIFSPEFRQAFKRILFGGHRGGVHYRSGKL